MEKILAEDSITEPRLGTDLTVDSGCCVEAVVYVRLNADTDPLTNPACDKVRVKCFMNCALSLSNANLFYLNLFAYALKASAREL